MYKKSHGQPGARAACHARSEESPNQWLQLRVSLRLACAAQPAGAAALTQDSPLADRGAVTRRAVIARRTLREHDHPHGADCATPRTCGRCAETGCCWDAGRHRTANQSPAAGLRLALATQPVVVDCARDPAFALPSRPDRALFDGTRALGAVAAGGCAALYPLLEPGPASPTAESRAGAAVATGVTGRLPARQQSGRCRLPLVRAGATPMAMACRGATFLRQ